jgi:TRAP-type mannitol/chloroaromatic compound transport system permease small subunit
MSAKLLKNKSQKYIALQFNDINGKIKSEKRDISTKIVKNINSINQVVGSVVTWVTSLLVLVVFTDVLMRYLFNTSFVFVQELEWHLFAFIFLIGAGYTFLKEGHVRVDIIYQKLSRKQRAWVNCIGGFVFLIPGCILIIATSIPWVITSWSINEISPDPGGIPFRFILKSMVPLGFFLFLLQGIALIIKSIKTITADKSK